MSPTPNRTPGWDFLYAPQEGRIKRTAKESKGIVKNEHYKAKLKHMYKKVGGSKNPSIPLMLVFKNNVQAHSN